MLMTIGGGARVADSSREGLMAEMLPDSLGVGLGLVFVGTAAGRRSAAVGAYYAHPGNRFWRTLHEVGLTPRQLEPSAFRSLLAHGIGFTDIAKVGAGLDREIARRLYDVEGFAAKLALYRPRAVAFTSKKAASVWLGRPTGKIQMGRQAECPIDSPDVFVLPSTSGAATRFWSIEPWQNLAEWQAIDTT